MIYLASQSPRRVELLQQIGVLFQQCLGKIDETPLANEPPEVYVQRMAKEKALAAWQRLNADTHPMDMPLLSADTTVVFEGNILGKPNDDAHAKAMLQQLSGQTHQVMSSVVIYNGIQLLQRLVVTNVHFNTLAKTAIEHYIASKEPFGKAGAYAIQGFGAIFIDRIVGSYSNVVGLPLTETAELLTHFNIPIWQQ